MEMGEAEKCPHPREPITAQIGGWEMIAQCATYTASVFVSSHFKDKGENKRPLTPTAV